MGSRKIFWGGLLQGTALLLVLVPFVLVHVYQHDVDVVPPGVC